MNKYTPGPWRFTADEGGINFRLLAGDKEIIGGCGCCDSPWIVGMDNARLIAAAPELHAENERLHAEIKRLRQIVQYCPPIEVELREVSDRLFAAEAENERLRALLDTAGLTRAQAEHNALRAECDALRRHLNYWLPDETMVPQGHESAYRAACAALAARGAA